MNEECDDGNMLDGDGCSSSCLYEFCGDGVLQEPLGETCDDANTTPLDGCDSVCQLESRVRLFGNPEGGQIFFTVQGVALSINTVDAMTLELAVQSMALAVQQDTTLQVLGISASSIGRSLITNGEITDLSTTDPGITFTHGPYTVPTMGTLGSLVLCGLLMGFGAWEMHRRRTSPQRCSLENVR